uniref:Uncharacterized protein n=1 Tax=Catharus ustulatus TaxID=91951 RepID=A0A8C3UV65_CATUS
MCALPRGVFCLQHPQEPGSCVSSSLRGKHASTPVWARTSLRWAGTSSIGAPFVVCAEFLHLRAGVCVGRTGQQDRTAGQDSRTPGAPSRVSSLCGVSHHHSVLLRIPVESPLAALEPFQPWSPVKSGTLSVPGALQPLELFQPWSLEPFQVWNPLQPWSPWQPPEPFQPLEPFATLEPFQPWSPFSPWSPWHPQCPFSPGHPYSLPSQAWVHETLFLFFYLSEQL